MSERKTHCCIKILCSAGEIACRGHRDFYLGSDGGFVVPEQSNIGQEMRVHIERLASWDGGKQLIPVCIEDNIFKFYPSKEVKSTETEVVNTSQQPGTE